MSNLDFLNTPAGGEEPTVVVTPEPQPEPIAEPEVIATPEATGEDRPRDANGRFISPQAGDPPLEPAAPPSGYVPISALQEERQRTQSAKAELARIQQGALESGIPDPYSDPEGFAEYMGQQTRSAVMNTRLDISEDMARTKHGDDVVDAVLVWAKDRFAQSPAYHQEVLAQRNPYEFAVQSYRREQALANVDMTELDAFRAWKAAQQNPNPAPLAPHPASPPPPVTPPPQSLNAMPSAGVATHVPTGPGVAFDGLFKR